MTVIDVGLRTKHDKDLVINRPEGAPFYLFLQAVSSAVVGTVNGRREMAPGDCILHTPGFPRYLATRAQDMAGFENNWVIFSGDGAGVLLNQYGILLNDIIPDSSVLETTTLLHGLYFEQRYRRSHYDRRSVLILEELFIAFNRQSRVLPQPAGRVHPETLRRLHGLRDDLYLRPERVNGVAQMACRVQLTPSYFAQVYQKAFAMTPARDITRARIEKAKLLLRYEENSLADIACQCGFQNVYYFSTVFKRMTGQPPGVFRNG